MQSSPDHMQGQAIFSLAFLPPLSAQRNRDEASITLIWYIQCSHVRIGWNAAEKVEGD